MRTLAMTWVVKLDKYVGKVYTLCKGTHELLRIGNYYDSEHEWLLDLESPLSFLFDCEKKFRTPQNCMMHVEKVLLPWLDSCFFETEKLGHDDWDLLKDRIEKPMQCCMGDGHYQEVIKALEVPFKNIPKLMGSSSDVSKEVYEFRLEKGV